ncbi:MAG: PAS domain S-box protein [bacterium]|nr:PAS domain S-box protein [bacterium]
MSKIRTGYSEFKGLGESGEILLAQRNDGGFNYLLRLRYRTDKGAFSIPFNSNLAEPMRRALSGQSGSMIGLDYRGAKVLAAYQPLDRYGLGLVVKIDLAEVRRPYLIAGILSLVIGMAFVLIGAWSFFRITNPIQRQLIESEKRFQDAVRYAPFPAMIYAEDGEVLLVNQAWTDLSGYQHDDIPTIHDWTHKAYIASASIKEDYILNVLCFATQRIENGEVEIKTNGGEIQTWDFCTSPLGQMPDGRHCVISMANNVTNRKKVENDLRDSQMLYMSLVDHIPQSIYRKDKDSVYTFVSKPFCQFAGLGESDIIGKNDFELWPEELAKKYRQDDLAVMASGEMLDMTESNQSFDGPEKIVHTIKIPVRDYQGEIIGVQGIFWDITDSVQRERELVKLSQAIEQSFLAILITNRDGTIEYVNKSYIQMTGYSREELLGSRPNILNPEYHTVDYYAAIWEVINAGKQFIAEMECSNKSGNPYWELVTISPLRDDTGTIQNFIIVKQDITDHKKSEEQIRESERFAHSILNSLLTCVSILDESGNILHTNNAWDHYVESVSPGDKNQNYYQLLEKMVIPSSKLAEIIHAVQKLVAGESDKYSTEYASGDHLFEKRWFTLMISRFVGEGPVRLVAAHHDISQQKRMEEQFLQAQKLEAVGKLAGGIAHDFNNLLLVMRGYGSFLSESIPDDDPGQSDIREILHAVDRAADLTRQLLAFSRKQLLEEKEISVSELIMNLEKMLRRLIPEDIDIQFDLAPDTGYIKADPVQIEQIVINLVVNAKDAMAEGGHLFIQTKPIEFDLTYVDQNVEIEKGRYALISISDTGVGMDQEIQRKIFEPFFTTKEVGKGTGLGLATCYGIVKQSGGYIHVYSEPGKGATFNIYFPRIDEKGQGTLPTVIKPEFDSTTKYSILLVEDEESVRGVVKRTLESNNFTVVAVGSGIEAEQIIKEASHQFDLILTDVVMPNMSGKEVVQRIRTYRPEIRAIFMSGYPDSVIAKQGILDESFYYLQKPFTEYELLSRISEVLNQSGDTTNSPNRPSMN